MIVAAGFGTRLLPLTQELPKPALPVGNRPLAWFAIDHLSRSGVRELVVNTHHLAAELRAALEATRPEGTTLRFVHEPEILGTGGGLRNAWQPADGEDFLVMNGKLLFAPNIARLLARHRDSGAIATMVLRPLQERDTFSAVEIDADDRVRRLLGEPQSAGSGLRRMMFTGVQILSARAHRDLPDNGCVIRDAYRKWIDRGERVMALVDESAWRDLGVTLRHYLEGNQAVLHRAWPSIAPTDHDNLIDPTAEISSRAVISSSVIGENASIAPNVRIERSVVWPHARVTSDLIDSVLTTRGTRVTLRAPTPPTRLSA